jgi:hypothetical protein
MKLIKRLPPILLLCLLSVAFVPSLSAQGVEDEYIEDEGTSLWEEEKFLDATGKEFETEDVQYVGEDEVQAAEAAAKRSGMPSIDLAAALDRDKKLLGDNIVYGIGTGALLGGWLALVQGSSARDNARYLSVGVLTGALLGMVIGNKALIMPRTVKPVSWLETPGNPAEGSRGTFAFSRSQRNGMRQAILFPQLHFQFRF